MSLHQTGYVAVEPDASGYLNNSFAGKQEQLHKVCEYIASKGFLPADLVNHEVNWFYG
jgi:glutamate dehydrogenase